MSELGVIADTHNFLDPKVRRLFAGVDHILHAGDIGQPSLIRELAQLAPVTFVAGNTDEPGFRFKLLETLEFQGRHFLLCHIVNPYSLSDSLRDRIARDRPDAIVFGHSHKPFCQTLDGILFFNPGYAGKPRFGLARSVAILRCDAHAIRPQYFPL